jgi:serine/threonine-protein kinase RsbW
VSQRELNLTLPARAENVIVVRQAVAGLAEALGLPGRRIDDLKTVVTEASNNVVLHAYGAREDGPLEVNVVASDDAIEVTIADQGEGFQPRPNTNGEISLGIGLPLIASLSDGFEIRGGPRGGTSTLIRFDLQPKDVPKEIEQEPHEELAMAITAGTAVKPVLARVIGALAARAEFSVERLADTVLLGDAVSAHQGDDFASGRVELSIKDGDGTLDVRVGPLVEGGGERILGQMEVPGGPGSLRGLASTMEVTKGKAEDGTPAEFLVFEVSS